MSATPAKSSFWTSFGPGLIWAASSIGVSHLVQSTRAGAMAGFGLAGVILAALLFKYPFFEYGARYAAATGTSLVEGYRTIGRWALWLYLAITALTGVAATAAIVMFTSFLLRYALGITWPLPAVAALLLLVCAAILVVGRFRGLDLATKVILALLAASTLAAAIAVAPRIELDSFRLLPGSLVGTVVPFGFLLALVGWMPSPIDIAVWSSLWTLAKDRSTGQRTSVAVAKRDFLIGYLGTAVLAFGFLILGATVLHTEGLELSDQGAVFSTQLIDLYSQSLGAWARPVVMVAAFTTMFSTALAVVDGFPRAIERTLVNLRAENAESAERLRPGYYWGAMMLLSAVVLLVLVLFAGSLTVMVDFATIVSFLTAPVLGYLNLTVIRSDRVAPEHRPGPWMTGLSWLGLLLLGATGVAYLVTLI
ncbi:MAG: NRAMP family divalent metal transporter [Gemmatimonadales bacterium]